MSYKVVPIPDDVSSDVRETLISPQYRSLTANVSLATGYGPCRSCLQVFDEGRDLRIYLTYDPFDGLSSLPDPGPVFIHKDECARFQGDGVPRDLLKLPVLLEAFAEQSYLVSREPMEATTVDNQIIATFANPRVRFINLRNAEAGCFIARIERN
jgi:Protein of unknown function (DUF1203)